MVHGLFTTSAQFYHLEHMLKDPRFLFKCSSSFSDLTLTEHTWIFTCEIKKKKLYQKNEAFVFNGEILMPSALGVS